MDLSNENIIHIKKDDIEYIQFRRLLEFEESITHAFTVGKEHDYRMPLYNSPKKILTEEQIEKNKESYKKLCGKLGIEYNNIVKTNQVHGDLVKAVDNKTNSNMPDFCEEYYENTDGLITNKPNIAICATNADCIVLMMYDNNKKVIANVHSGWRGTLQKIACKTIDKMQEIYNCNTKDIICCISPSIRRCHFEVETDVKEMFENEFNKINYYIKPQNEKWLIDTVELNVELLKSKGLKKENIIDSKICTVCNSNVIHSYRGSNHQNGLEIGIIQLKTEV